MRHLKTKRYFYSCQLVALLLLVGCNNTDNELSLDAAGLQVDFSNTFEACELVLPGTDITASAECSSLDVPENPDDITGRQITLKIAKVAARDSGEARADPIFFFAGGPGQSATESYPIIAQSLAESNKTRDIVLVDQRGTGSSNKLNCDFGEAELQTDIEAEQLKDLARDCLSTLDADPRFYTTTVAMKDIDTVRQAMGYEQINLIGVSYGTRAAQVYLRDYPEHVRTVVLDSVVPPELLLGLEHAVNLDDALSKLFNRCAQEQECQDRFGDLSLQLAELRETIHNHSPSLLMRLPTSGEHEEVLVTNDVLAVAIRLLSYNSETQALIPILLEEATNGDFQPLASQALSQVQNLSDVIARGMEMSVICSEDVIFFPSYIDQTDTLLGQTLIDLIKAQCSVWPKGEVPADFHEPRLNNDVGVLLLSGELDPVTPPRYGDMAAKQFARSAHWVIPGRGHSVMRHGCLPDKVAEFIEADNPTEIDSSCVSDIHASPFFMQMTGPSP